MMELFHAGDRTPGNFQEFTVHILKKIIRYHYQQRPAGLGTISRQVLMDTLTKYCEDPPACVLYYYGSRLKSETAR